MVQAETIESKFLFKRQLDQMRYIKDGEGQTLGFLRQDDGNDIILTKDLEGIEVAIEHCPDGTKIFHMLKDSKGLPAMHEFKPDGTEFIYLFDEHKTLEKMVEMKHNGDKLTTWFSKRGETISQEQRQTGGILFKMSCGTNSALVWLHKDGSIESHGNGKLIAHLKLVFTKFLDGAE